MAYLGVSEAVRARLEGKSFAFVPLIDSVPQREHTPNPETSKATIPFARFMQQGRLVTNSFTVDIIEDGPDWIEYSRVYPSISFNIIDVSPRYDNVLISPPNYPAYDYFTPIETTEEDVKDGKFAVQAGARMLRHQPIEYPFNFMLEIQAHAKVEREAMALIAYVYEKFRPRGFLRVPRLNGSYVSWDMLFSDYSDRDAATGRRSISNEKEYKKVWTYVIEGYLDTSDQTSLVNTTQYRGLSVTQKE